MKTSADPRHLARKIALSVVYSVVNSDTPNFSLISEDLIETSSDSLHIVGYDKATLDKIVQGVAFDYDALLALILKHTNEWELANIYKIDLATMLIASWELKSKNAPVKVIIDEAVELAKEFGLEESPKFVNGVLAGITKELYDTGEPTEN